jgi:hypothetical protein
MDAIALCITFAKVNGKGVIRIQILSRGCVAAIIPITSTEVHLIRTSVHLVRHHHMKCSLQQVQRIHPSLEHLSAILERNERRHRTHLGRQPPSKEETEKGREPLLIPERESRLNILSKW